MKSKRRFKSMGIRAVWTISVIADALFLVVILHTVDILHLPNNPNVVDDGEAGS